MHARFDPNSGRSMSTTIQHQGETASNNCRTIIANVEPKSLRTFTPTQAVIARSSGVFLWTIEGRRLFDFTSGVLVANLGYNSTSWSRRFWRNMNWPATHPDEQQWFSALPMNSYNAITPIEAEASRRLVELIRKSPGGKRLEQVLWAASGSEAIQKALWCAMSHDASRPMIMATRYGFHGKKGLAGSVSGCETDHDRDPRVRFVSFPMNERRDVNMRNATFDPAPYSKELDSIFAQAGGRIGTFITEPYLGSAGSYHPPKEYLQLVQSFCREHDIVLVLDEVQANFGRTGEMFAFKKYGIEPDIVVLGKGLGNGVPVSAAVGRRDLLSRLEYGEGSDTWSANPLSSAAVLATLDEFASTDVLGNCHKSSAIIESGLVRLKELPFVANVRGEFGGMVWGLEMRDHGGRSAADWANQCVLACYRGDGSNGIHLLGPLDKKVLRIAPPLIITEGEAHEAMSLMHRILERIQ